MKKITSHLANPTDAGLFVEAIDEPDVVDGAHHVYRISTSKPSEGFAIDIAFQHGPVPKAGRNGVTEVALLAVLIDRIRHYQERFPSDCNAKTLAALEEALETQHQRTRDREARGIEGRVEKSSSRLEKV